MGAVHSMEAWQLPQGVRPRVSVLRVQQDSNRVRSRHRGADAAAHDLQLDMILGHPLLVAVRCIYR